MDWGVLTSFLALYCIQKRLEYHFQFGAYSKNPPIWAQDTFNNNEAYSCGYCDAWMTVVRPGKVQCDTCGDGFDEQWINYAKKWEK